MRLNTTGIAARMMLSLDKKAIGEKLINGRQINPTPLQVRYPQGVREVLGIMSEQLAISTADLTRILLEDALHNMFMPADNTTGNIISRIEYIMLSHDIMRHYWQHCCRHGISAPRLYRTRPDLQTIFQLTLSNILLNVLISIRTG